MAIYVLLIIFLFYSLVIIKVYLPWNRAFNDDLNSIPNLNVSIIIPFRNEAENIVSCIESILDQSYPFFELILVDDHSSDHSIDKIKLIADTRILILKNSDDMQGKKAALEHGIGHAQHTWIVTIDADTLFQPEWLENMMKYSDQYDCLVGPIKLGSDSTWLSQFQMWDFIALQGFTKAGIDYQKYYMANGANLAFKKAWFLQVGGYAGNVHIASGDDYFLMDKFRRIDPARIGYVTSRKSIGLSKSMLTLKDLINQRIRWGGKMKHLGSHSMNLLLVLIWTTNLLWVGLILMTILVTPFTIIGVALVIIKMAVDYLLLRKVGAFFNERLHPLRFFLISLLYAIYVVVAGILSLLINSSQWKGRPV